jgi:hypothetical protein
VTLLYAYNFDEASGNIIDRSGNSRDVVYSGSLARTASAAGHTDKGMSQTTTSIDSNGPAIAGLQTANYTVMAWVKRTSNALDGWICELKASGSGDRGILFLGGNIQSRARNSGGTVVAATVAQPSAGTWYHAAGSYDGTTLRLFINGTQVATAALTAPLKTTSTGSHLLDALGSDTIIDDVRYYDTALAAGEISTLMATPVTGASTTVSGTVAGTLSGFTGAFVGSARATGSVTGSLPPLAGAFTGSARASGSVAGVLPAMTGSLTGQARVAASLSAALPAFNGELTGSLEVSGTVTASLPAFTGALTGEVATPGTPVTGTLTGSLGALQGSVTGGFTVSGTIPGGLPALVGAFTASASLSGQLTGILPALVASFTGTAGPVVEYTPADTATLTPRAYTSTATAREREPSVVARSAVSTATVRSPE